MNVCAQACVGIYVWQPEVDIGCLPSVAGHLSLSLDPKLTDLFRLTGQWLQGDPFIFIPPPSAQSYLAVYMDAGNLNLDPYACHLTITYIWHISSAGYHLSYYLLSIRSEEKQLYQLCFHCIPSTSILYKTDKCS